MLFASFSSLQRDHEFLNTYIKTICSVSTGVQTTHLKCTGLKISIWKKKKKKKISIWEDEEVLKLDDSDELHNNVNTLNAIKLYI